MDNLPPYFPGNKAICVAPTYDLSMCWLDGRGKEIIGPKYNEEVTILSFKWCIKDNLWLLMLKEHQPNDEGFSSKWFKPIQESPFSSMTTKEVVEKELTLISQN